VLAQAELFQAIGVHAGFDAGHAAETPVGPGHLAEAELLGLVDGLVGGAEAVEEGLEFGGVLVGEEGVAEERSWGGRCWRLWLCPRGSVGRWRAGVTAVGVDLQLEDMGHLGGAEGGCGEPSL